MILLGAKRMAAKPVGVAHLFSTSARAADAAHKVVVVGGGTAGLTVSHQLLRSGKFQPNDIAIVEPSKWHHYQPGWTLVGGGLKNTSELCRQESSLIDPKIQLYEDRVATFAPDHNQVTTETGEKLTYGQLVVAPGFEITLDKIPGLKEAIADPNSKVTSIYTAESADQVYGKIKRLEKGRAIFTQPASPIKCAGAPQKVMWLAMDHWTKAGLYKPHDAQSPIQVDFATGLPVMFGVPKYSEVLNKLREERGAGGLFQHELVAIEDNGNTAVFSSPEGEKRLSFDLLHATPIMASPAFVKNSVLANQAGFVDVDPATTQQVKYKNVWSLGDASSLPTSKTAAAITAEAPVLVHNLLQAMEGKEPDARYDGYTSCPLITEYGKVLLAEFKYGGVPQETFAKFGINQGKPQMPFYYLKKDFFPWVYFNNFVKGTWEGPKGFRLGNRGYATLNRPRTFSTSALAQRNTPARRPRDPLEKGSVARFPLATGETFIARTPPTPASSRATLESAESLFARAEPVSASTLATLPPMLPKRHRQARQAHAVLTPEQIAEVQKLRVQDPFSNTAGVLAKQFGCSPTFVSMVAPAPKEVRNARHAETQLKRATWGMNKRIAQEERRERRALW